jgi:hypothetical protein
MRYGLEERLSSSDQTYPLSLKDQATRVHIMVYPWSALLSNMYK